MEGIYQRGSDNTVASGQTDGSYSLSMAATSRIRRGVSWGRLPGQQAKCSSKPGMFKDVRLPSSNCLRMASSPCLENTPAIICQRQLFWTSCLLRLACIPFAEGDHRPKFLVCLGNCAEIQASILTYATQSLTVSYIGLDFDRKKRYRGCGGRLT